MQNTAREVREFLLIDNADQAFINEPSLWDPLCYYNLCAATLQNTQIMF